MSSVAAVTRQPMMRFRFRYVLGVMLCALFVANSAHGAKKSRCLTSPALDEIIDGEIETPVTTPLVSDDDFLRRVSFDLIGRQPSYAEIHEFENDHQPDKRSREIERLLNASQFGGNWANYWCDTVSYRVTPPTKANLDYGPFKAWMAEQLNRNRPWSEITRDVVTATGSIEENPAGTFIGFHQGNPAKLSTEVSRIFLGVNIQCAECHDHPFDDWKRRQFHQMAAFFGRLDADTKEVCFEPEASYSMPDAKDSGLVRMPLSPVTFTGDSVADFEETTTDPRFALADWMTASDNPWFAKAYVNRVWTVLTGKGFYPSVDNMSDHGDHELPRVHEALTQHFIASGYDVKGLFRLILNTETYQRQVATAGSSKAHAASAPRRLRSDEVYQELVASLGIPSQPIRKLGRRVVGKDPIMGLVSAKEVKLLAKTVNSALGDAVARPVASGATASAAAIATAGRDTLTPDGSPKPTVNASLVSISGSAAARTAPADVATSAATQTSSDNPVLAAVSDRFGYDPSLRTEQVPPTIGQALLLMNREDLQQFIKADPSSGTELSKVLLAEKNDRKAIDHLYEQVLAREPTDGELRIVLAHIKRLNNRGAAFEDLLWSLVNSTEFTTKH